MRDPDVIEGYTHLAVAPCISEEINDQGPRVLIYLSDGDDSARLAVSVTTPEGARRIADDLVRAADQAESGKAPILPPQAHPYGGRA